METQKGANARYIGPMSKAVSAELRAALARAGKSATQLSKDANLSKSTLHKTLKGDRVVDVEDLYEICWALGIEPHEIIEAATEVANRNQDDGLLAHERFDISPEEMAAAESDASANIVDFPQRDARPYAAHGPDIGEPIDSDLE